ncbi:PE-PPE domain-containing protein [Mycolicibacterium stellerae]|uniref:PE-PPE domain-containing protein n=1 Tax=Mycolicibacterium stellerae TaxID=2358193 RepID=UPI000F0BD1FC|nr:PE-PPE domain-containing protein [Mycolicibacterium stellerae]
MRSTGRSLARSTFVAILTALAALLIGVASTLTSAVTASLGLTAFQALIVPGTGTPHAANDYLDNAVNYYVLPGANPPCSVAAPAGPCPTTQGIDYYATFWPIPLPGWGGLQGQKWNVSVASGVTDLTGKYDGIIADPDPALADQQIVIFGYSQGATVASNFKRLHADDPWDIKARTDYFYIGNPQRPSGGFFERLAFLGNVPILDAQFGDPSPTDTCTDEKGALRTCATDFALQYDGVADFPQWLLNPLAVANAVAGFQYVHGTYLAPNGDDPVTETPYGYTVEEVQDAVAAAQASCTAATYCQQVEGSDTIYVTLPARYLPLYQPLIDIGDATGTSALIVPIVDLISPATQTLIETGYDRTDYSNPQPGTLLPPKTFNPIQTAVDLVNDVPEGINMALTPGRTPLPGSPPIDDSLSSTSTNTIVSTATTPKLTTPDIRLGLFAKPGEGAPTGTGSSANRPLQNALKDFHPVRDVVKAVSDTAKNALGKDDSSSSGDDSE